MKAFNRKLAGSVRARVSPMLVLHDTVGLKKIWNIQGHLIGACCDSASPICGEWRACSELAVFISMHTLSFTLACRVVHLDLKSLNVLIAADGSAKISDVGLSALMKHSCLSQSLIGGTQAWMAPEVMIGGQRPTHGSVMPASLGST